MRMNTILTSLCAAALLIGATSGANAMSEAERAKQIADAQAQGVIANAPTPTQAIAEMQTKQPQAATMSVKSYPEGNNVVAQTAPKTTTTTVTETTLADGTPINITTSPDVSVSKMEKVIEKTYVVTKRKVGTVGGRPYPATTQTVDGGVLIERQIGASPVTTEIVKADPFDGIDPASGEGDYYSNIEKAKVYKAKPFHVDVHEVGRFND